MHVYIHIHTYTLYAYMYKYIYTYICTWHTCTSRRRKGGEKGREEQECTGCLMDPACINGRPFAIITGLRDRFRCYIKSKPQYSARPLSEAPLPLRTPQWQTCLSEPTPRGFRARGYPRIRPNSTLNSRILIVKAPK